MGTDNCNVRARKLLIIPMLTPPLSAPADQLRSSYKQDDQTLDHRYHVSGNSGFTAHTQGTHFQDTKSKDVKRTPAGWFFPRMATAIPVKPKEGENPSIKR